MYAKIFQQIYDSSIADDPKVRLTFMDLLVLADSEGVVDMTHEAISRRTNVPLDWVKSSLDLLEKPDPRSRTSEHEGRRIERLDDNRDWGWRILNYKAYRDMKSEFDRKSYMRNYMRERRSVPVKPLLNSSLTESNNVKLSPSPSVASSFSTEGGTGGTNGSGFPKLDEVLTEAQMRNYPAEQSTDFWNHFEASGWIDKNGHPVVNWRPKLARWISSEKSRQAENEQRRPAWASHKPKPIEQVLADEATAQTERALKRLGL